MTSTSLHCDADRHAACHGCDCGCHWLFPLAAGSIDQHTTEDGRTWTRRPVREDQDQDLEALAEGLVPGGWISPLAHRW